MTRPSATTASLERALAQIEAEAGEPDGEARAALAHLKAVLAVAGAATVADDADGGGLGAPGRGGEASGAPPPTGDAALAAQVDALRTRLEAVEAAVRGLDGPARDLVAAGLRDAGLVGVAAAEDEGEAGV